MTDAISKFVAAPALPQPGRRWGYMALHGWDVDKEFSNKRNK